MSDRKESGTREVAMMSVIEHLCPEHKISNRHGFCLKCGGILPPIRIKSIPWDEVPTLELQEVQVNSKST